MSGYATIDMGKLQNAFNEAGLVCDNPVMDGNRHRCGTTEKPTSKNGSYTIFTDSNPYLCCWNFTRGGERMDFPLADSWVKVSPEEAQKRDEAIRQATEQRDKELQEQYAKARAEAQEIWNSAEAVPNDFPYLKRKQLYYSSGVSRLKYSPKRGLIIPIYDANNELQSLQFIGAEKVDGHDKWFLPGGKIGGGRLFTSVEGGNDEDKVLLIGEGWATVQSAVDSTFYWGVVVFSCNNLKAVAEEMRTKYHDWQIVILEDDDRKNEARGFNTGVERAYEAAKAANAYIAHVGALEGQSMDFNDLYCQEDGYDKIEEIINATLQAETPSATWEMNRLWVEEHKRGNVIYQPKVTADGKAPAAAKTVGKAPAKSAEPEPWVEPVEFAKVSIPPIEPEYLPTLIGNYCSEMARQVQVPFELFLSDTLAVISSTIQGMYEVQIDTGYSVPLNLYTICPLDSANRKSLTMNLCRTPLLNWQLDKNKEIDDLIRQAKNANRVIDLRITGIESRLKKGVDDREAADLQKEMERLEKQKQPLPTKITLAVTNPTPEGLTRAMLRNHERMAILSDEGGFLNIIAGRYSSGVPNLDIILSGWDGGYYTAERSNEDNNLCLYHPLLAIGLTPQWKVLRDCFSKSAFRETGCCARFLYFTPESLRGQHKRRMTRQEPAFSASPQTVLAYVELINRLLDERWERYQEELEAGEVLQPKVLHITDEAYAAWAEFDQGVDEDCKDGGEYAEMFDWAGKLAGHVGRMAGLFHIIEHDDPAATAIDAVTMKRAIYLGQSLIEHARNAYGIINTEDTEKDAQKILSWLEAGKLETFTVRDCKQAMKRQMKPACVEPALLELEDRYYIREQEVPGAGKVRKTKRKGFEVNPKFLNPSKA